MVVGVARIPTRLIFSEADSWITESTIEIKLAPGIVDNFGYNK
jgi:hypothetical protein